MGLGPGPIGRRSPRGLVRGGFTTTPTTSIEETSTKGTTVAVRLIALASGAIAVTVPIGIPAAYVSEPVVSSTSPLRTGARLLARLYVMGRAPLPCAKPMEATCASVPPDECG